MKEKLKKLYFKIIGPIKRRKFKYKDFTIISNNCFGGIIYRNHNMPYLTPTAGLFIMPKDYIKFINNMKEYLKIEPIQINVEDSNYYKYLKTINYEGLIGKIDDIEIMFLHYKDFEDAKNKWIRRSKRINYNRILYKFNDQNQCTYDELESFSKFPAKNKILFTAKKYNNINSYVLKKFEKDGYVIDDTKNKNIKDVFNIYNYINNVMR